MIYFHAVNRVRTAVWLVFSQIATTLSRQVQQVIKLKSYHIIYFNYKYLLKNFKVRVQGVLF